MATVSYPRLGRLTDRLKQGVCACCDAPATTRIFVQHDQMRGNDEALKVCDEHYKCARNSSGLVSVLEGARAKKERDAVALADRLARKVQCPECGKRVTPAGLQMHARVSHADTAVDVAGALRAFEERRTAPPSVKETSHGVAAASVDTKNWKG